MLCAHTLAYELSLKRYDGGIQGATDKHLALHAAL